MADTTELRRLADLCFDWDGRYMDDAAETRVPVKCGELRALLDRVESLTRELREIEQILGKALGYPWFKDDRKNFPDATEADGVCVGEHTPVTIAAAYAQAALKAALEAAGYDPTHWPLDSGRVNILRKLHRAAYGEE